jgi:SAM-dependent methyltransferase
MEATGLGKAALSQIPYSQRLLRNGKGLLAWQRHSRFRNAVDALANANGQKRYARLVDIGAADGIGYPFWRQIADEVLSFNYYLSHAKQFKEAFPENFNAAADGRHLPVKSGLIDVVVCMETLHLIPGFNDRLQCFRDIKRILKADGLFACSVPIEVGMTAFVKYLGRRWKGFELEGMTFSLMLKHCFYRFFDVVKYDKGRQVGFNAFHFTDMLSNEFKIVKTIALPLPAPFNTNLLLIGRVQRGGH